MKHKVDLMLQNTDLSSFVRKAKITTGLGSIRPPNTFDKGVITAVSSQDTNQHPGHDEGRLREGSKPMAQFGEHNAELLTAPCLWTTGHT